MKNLHQSILSLSFCKGDFAVLRKFQVRKNKLDSRKLQIRKSQKGLDGKCNICGKSANLTNFLRQQNLRILRYSEFIALLGYPPEICTAFLNLLFTETIESPAGIFATMRPVALSHTHTHTHTHRVAR